MFETEDMQQSSLVCRKTTAESLITAMFGNEIWPLFNKQGIYMRLTNIIIKRAFKAQ